MTSVQIPISVFKEFMSLIEKKLGSLVSLPDEARDAVDSVTEKAREIAATVGLEVGEPSRPRDPLTASSNLQSQSVRTRNDTAKKRPPEPDTTDNRKKVKRRRRRVSNKTNKTRTNADDLVLPDFRENKDLKYLTAQLTRSADNEQRARIYKEYLGCCKFNATYDPSNIIQFDDEDARSLGVWGAQTTCETQTATVIPQVKIKKYVPSMFDYPQEAQA